MIEETGKSILESLKQRFTSPFSGALIISWFLWNFKVPLILIFPEPDVGIIGKLDLIYSEAYHDGAWWYVTIFAYLLPIVSAFLIVWVYPKLTNKAHEKSIEFKVDKHNKTVIQEGKLTLTQEEVDVLKTKWNDKFLKLRQELSEKEVEVDGLKEEIILLNKNTPAKVDNAPKEEFATNAELFLRKIKSEYVINDFKKIFEDINGKVYIKKDNPFVLLSLRFQLITLENEKFTNTDFATYSLTQLGNTVYQQLINDELIEYTSENGQTKKSTEEILISKIINKEYKTEFEDTLTLISKKSWIKNSDWMDYFMKLDLIEVSQSSNGPQAKYTLTSLGKQVKVLFAEIYF